jgi:hypothetical protein
MGSLGYFTKSDKGIIQRAAFLAEGLTQRYFGLSDDVWKRNGYGMFTLQEVNESLSNPNAFANVIRYESRGGTSDRDSRKYRYGVVLHDPNILLALLRSTQHDLWTLGLFVLTHELTHIVRFRDFGVNFFAPESDRNREEITVHGMTREILAGVTNTDYVLNLYESQESSFLESQELSDS